MNSHAMKKKPTLNLLTTLNNLVTADVHLLLQKSVL